jgi:hypothetical protein
MCLETVGRRFGSVRGSVGACARRTRRSGQYLHSQQCACPFRADILPSELKSELLVYMSQQRLLVHVPPSRRSGTGMLVMPVLLLVLRAACFGAAPPRRSDEARPVAVPCYRHFTYHHMQSLPCAVSIVPRLHPAYAEGASRSLQRPIFATMQKRASAGVRRRVRRRYEPGHGLAARLARGLCAFGLPDGPVVASDE